MRYVKLDSDNRICSTTEYAEFAEEGAIEYDFPEDFDFSLQDDYLIQNGELVYSPLDPEPGVRINELKQKLAETDYVVIKIAEAQVTGVEMLSEDADRYAEIILQRQQWRDQINELEKGGA